MCGRGRSLDDSFSRLLATPIGRGRGQQPSSIQAATTKSRPAVSIISPGRDQFQVLSPVYQEESGPSRQELTGVLRRQPSYTLFHNTQPSQQHAGVDLSTINRQSHPTSTFGNIVEHMQPYEDTDVRRMQQAIFESYHHSQQQPLGPTMQEDYEDVASRVAYTSSWVVDQQHYRPSSVIAPSQGHLSEEDKRQIAQMIMDQLEGKSMKSASAKTSDDHRKKEDQVVQPTPTTIKPSQPSPPEERNKLPDDKSTAVTAVQSAPTFIKDCKLKHYAGDSDVDYFLSQFSMAARLGHWPEDQLGDILGTYLIGKARRLLPTDSAEPSLSFRELSKRLKARFGTEAEPDYFEVLLETCQRKEKESVHELMGRIIDLVDKAHPTVGVEERKKLYKGPFIRALSDESQREAVRMGRPKTIEQAAELAIVYESHARSENSGKAKTKKPMVRSINYDVINDDGTSTDINVASGNGKSTGQKNKPQNQKTTSGAVRSPVAGSGGDISVLTTMFATVIEKLDKMSLPAPISSQEPSRRPAGVAPNHRNCFHCRKPGHIRRYCPARRSEPPTDDQENEEGRDSMEQSPGQESQ